MSAEAEGLVGSIGVGGGGAAQSAELLVAPQAETEQVLLQPEESSEPSPTSPDPAEAAAEQRAALLAHLTAEAKQDFRLFKDLAKTTGQTPLTLLLWRQLAATMQTFDALTTLLQIQAHQTRLLQRLLQADEPRSGSGLVLPEGLVK